MADSAFIRDEELTAIAIAYKNPDTTLIADEVFPRTPPMGKREFKWTKYDDARGFSVPDTRVGEYGQVPQIKLTGTPQTDSCVDHGLDIPLTASDLKDAPARTNPRGYATEQATNLVMLDREVRAAGLAFDPAQYPTANKVNLASDLGGGAGAEQWQNAGADPLATLITGIESCWVRPNVLCLGQAAWNALSLHPKIVSAAIGNDGTNGRATKERLAELLEVGEVIVGTGWVNSVKPGKTPVLARVWGPHALAFYRDRTVTQAGGMTFGLTAQYGMRVAGRKVVDMGLHGGELIRSGESVKEVIVANRAAYFFQNAVA